MATIRQAFLRLKNGWGQSLRWRVLTGFLTTLLVFLGLQGYLALRASYTGIQDEIAQSNRQLADLAIQGISAQYDAILQQVIFLRTDLASSGTALEVQARDMLDFRRNWPLTYRALYLFDDEGQLLIHLADPLDRLMAIKTPAEILSRAPVTPGADVWAAWREAGDRGGAIYVSPVRIVGADQLPVITLGVALPDRAVSGAWRLVVEIDLRDIWREVDKFYVGQTGREFITSADGLIIAHPDRAYIGQRLPSALQPVLAGQGGQVEYLDPLSNRVMLAAFMPVSQQSGWGLIIEQQQSEALLPATRILAVSIGIALAASVLATLIALWLSRSITRPILRLAQVTQLIARTGNLHHNVAAFDRRDEIGQLALAFNQMIAGLRQTGEVLRESEDKYRRLVETTLDWVWAIDSENVHTYSNHAIYSLLGYQVGEIVGNSAYPLIHPEDEPWVRAMLRQCAEQKVGWQNVSIRWLHKDGSIRTFESAASPIVNAEGRLVGLSGVDRDITDRKRAEEKLRLSEASLKVVNAQLNEAQHIASIGSWTHAPDRAMPEWSDEMFWIFGLDPRNGVPAYPEFRRLFHPDQHSRLDDAINAMLATGQGYSLELRVTRPDGRERIIHLQCETISGDTDRPSYILGTAQDITERKQAEEELRVALAKYKTLFECFPLGITVTDEAGHILETNPIAEKLLSVPQDEHTRRDIDDPEWRIIRLDGTPMPPDEFASMRALQEKRVVENVEMGIVKPDHTITWLSVTAAPLPVEGHGVVITYGDITARKRAEAEIQRLNAELEERVIQRTAQLEAANKELEAFSYSVSHDLRAPLRGIDGWSQALLEDYGDQLDAQAQTYIHRVRSETQRMGRLIDDILQLSWLTRAEMRAERVDLSAIAQAIAARLQERAPERSVDLTLEKGLSAQGDPRLLEIALTNLLGNAFKFTGKTPQARIEFGQTEWQGQRAFFVRDNGAGFDMAFAGKLFGAFQRMHKTSEFPGTGIGLATVQRIIHRHGGRVWAEAAVDQGATFYFTLEEDR